MSWLKAIAAFVIAVAIVWVVLPQMLGVLSRATVDQGVRPLVMITTSGGDRPYQLRIKSYVDTDGDYRFVAFFLADEVTYGDDGNTFPIATQVTLATPSADAEMTCEPGAEAAEAVEIDNVGVGVRRLLEVDATSGRFSSVKYDDAPDPTPSPSGTEPGLPTGPDVDAALEGVSVFRYETSVWLLDDAYDYSASAVTSTGDVFAIECSLNRSLVWDSTDRSNPTKQPQATFLAPEFNFGPVGERSDFQEEMVATMSLARGAGMEVVSAFPEPIARSSDWLMNYSTNWSGRLTEVGNFGYTDAPTIIMSNRDAAGNEQNWLLWGGLFLGLAVTLVVRGLSDLADATLLRKGE